MTATGDGALFDARAIAVHRYNNSDHAITRYVRRRHDDILARRSDLVVSRAAAGPVIAYSGFSSGLLNVLALLERRRHAQFGAGSARITIPRGGSCPPDVDLLLLGVDIDQLPPASPTCLHAPFRVHLAVDTSRPLEEIHRRISKRERTQFRTAARTHGWQLSSSRDLDTVDRFYTDMHLPTMASRHAEQARTEPLAVARHIARNGRLFLLQQNGTSVAGALCYDDGRTLTTRLLGVLDGADQHYESGAFKAIYHLILDWASEHGRATVDFFGTEALLSKGIFQWKRKLGPAVVLPPNHFARKRLCLRLRSDTPAVRDFLAANPLLLIETGNRLRPTFFIDQHRPKTREVSAKVDGALPEQSLDLDEMFAANAAATQPRHTTVWT